MYKIFQKIRNNKKKTALILFLVLIVAAFLFIPISMKAMDSQMKEITVSTEYSLPENYGQHRSQQKYFKTADGQIAYTDHGEGDVLVLLHGVPTSSWMYRKVIPELQDDFRVISIDMLGFGSSDKPKNTEFYTSEKQADRVFELLESLEIKSWTQIFHDMGGLVTWKMLEKNPGKLKNLIFLNTIIEQENFNPPFLFPKNALSKLPLMMYEKPLGSEFMIWSTFANGMKGSSLSKEDLYGYVYPMREGSGDAIYHFFTQFNEVFFEKLKKNKEILENFPGKIFVLWGGKDKILTKEQIPFLEEHGNLEKENIHIFEEADHFLLEQVPEGIVKQVRKFLGK